MSRRVVVTGGTRGLGAAISLAFKEAGYKVCAIYAGNEDAAKKFEKENGISTIKADISDYNQCLDAVKTAEEILSGNIEVLINNAGITRDSMMHKMNVDAWDAVIKTNLSSVFYMSKSVIEKMRAEKFGRIINMSSVNANGMMGQTNYSAAKAGIEGFTKALALESARSGITVNAIAPGYMNTEMVAAVPKEALDAIISKVPAQRLGEASEIARAALFLADDLSGFINGIVLPVNGALRV